jgi:hypothetical protein
MGLSRSFILILLLICFSVIQGAVGIEFLFSQDDMSIDSYYDVDDSVAVEEEASATYGSGITDERKASGKGHIYADQYLISNRYRGFVQAHGSAGGTLTGSACMTPTALSVDQSAALGGSNVYALVEGWQGYNGGIADTMQDAAVQGLPFMPGYLKATQTLGMGNSIYSSQNTHAFGYNSYALGAAGIIDRYEGLGSFKGQGALVGVASILDPYGTIDADLYAEVIRTPVYIDPLATGHIEAHSDGIAFGGALAGDLGTDMNQGKIDAKGAAALTGVYGGELEADVGARTDESQSAWIDGQASGAVALQAAAAGDVNANLAKQKANAKGAIIGAGAVVGQAGGSMSASTNKNSAKVQGESVYAGGFLAGIGTAAGDVDAKWKNGLKISTEGSAVGAAALVGAVEADRMSASINNRGTKAKISGLSANGGLVAAGGIAYYKPLNGQFSLAGVYTFLSGSLTDGTLVAKTKWTNKGLRLKSTGDIDASGSGMIFGLDPAGAGTDGPGIDDSDNTGGLGLINNHLKMTSMKPVGGKGKADVKVT